MGAFLVELSNKYILQCTEDLFELLRLLYHGYILARSEGGYRLCVLLLRVFLLFLRTVIYGRVHCVPGTSQQHVDVCAC